MPPAHQHADEPESGPDLVAAAAGNAHVGAGDLEEAVAAGFGDHRLEQHARSLLALGASREHAPGALQLVGEVVAQDLQVTEAQQAWAASPADRDVDGVGGKAGDQGVGQQALEASDLRAQGAPGRILLHRRRERREDVPRELVGDHHHAVDPTLLVPRSPSDLVRSFVQAPWRRLSAL